MLLFYVRHGDPIYDPDSLTPLGRRQAEAVAKRLALYGVDEIYSSTSTRAMQTAQPTCEILKKELTTLEFAHENLAWRDLAVDLGDGKRWVFQHDSLLELFTQPEIRRLDDRWYEHPALQAYPFDKGMQRIAQGTDDFLASLGYEHIPCTGKYRVTAPNEKRVAFFAHQGFGLAFLSCLLDIPYPRISTHFDICHTGMTVIRFEEKGGFAMPKVLTLSSDSHLYREGLPTNYNHELRF